MEIDPAALDVADRYKLLIGAIVPRPIAFVSTVSPDGARTNLAPFSFFTAVGSNPMTLMFCPANNPDGSEKDTLRNAKLREEGGVGQFVVNVVSEAIAAQAAACAQELPYGESEFDLSRLTPTPSAVVKPPRVRESLVSFECETTHVVRTNPGARAGGNVVFGRVVHVHVDDAIVNERFHIDPAKLGAVGRMAGLTYCTTRQRFDLPWGAPAMDLAGGALPLPPAQI
jgi:flavin reductase (DIM6/NTAB) family NADH-FMN oxidoreductase RutF